MATVPWRTGSGSDAPAKTMARRESTLTLSILGAASSIAAMVGTRLVMLTPSSSIRRSAVSASKFTSTLRMPNLVVVIAQPKPTRPNIGNTVMATSWLVNS
ncbi:hypothetical protein D3C78_1668260 [compost metagenome]